MLSELQKRKLTVYFRSIDSDGNGVIQKTDFEQHAGYVVAARNAAPGSPTYNWVYNKWMKEWERLATFADTNQDGEVTLEEWFDFHYKELQLDQPYWKIPEEEGGETPQEFLFDILDLDEDGVISWKEYSLFLTAYAVEEELHREIFEKLDLDGDGIISRGEWIELADQFYADDAEAPGNWLMGPY